MLWEEVKKYTKLTGEDATHVPIMKIGAYLDGYDKGTEVLDKIRAEIEALPKTYPFTNHIDTYVKEDDVKRIIDKYRAESEE